MLSVWLQNPRGQNGKARSTDGGAPHRLPPSLRASKRENRRRAQARRRTLRVLRPRSRLRRTQSTLIRTRGGPMTAQCDAESERASRVWSRSQRPGRPSRRPMHRPVRTKATAEASTRGSCFSNVAARTPAWQCAPAGGRTCRQRHAPRSIVSLLEALAATVVRSLQRRPSSSRPARTPCPR